LSITFLQSSNPPDISLVYPTKRDVLQSHDSLLGGGCLPYARKTHEKQVWLEKFLCSWKAEETNRNKAMPHIKEN
jgi:hypothetical protein